MLIVPLAVTDKRTICPRPKVTTWSAVASLTFFTCIVGSQVNPSSGKIAVVKFTENNISMNINISMLRGVTNYSQYKFANTRGQELDDRVWIDNYYQNQNIVSTTTNDLPLVCFWIGNACVNQLSKEVIFRCTRDRRQIAALLFADRFRVRIRSPDAQVNLIAFKFRILIEAEFSFMFIKYQVDRRYIHYFYYLFIFSCDKHYVFQLAH